MNDSSQSSKDIEARVTVLERCEAVGWMNGLKQCELEGTPRLW
jgi:hypothetical protein